MINDQGPKSFRVMDSWMKNIKYKYLINISMTRNDSYGVCLRRRAENVGLNE